MFKKIIFTIALLSLFLSCRTEDRHPDIAMFNIDPFDDIVIKEVDEYMEFITDTDDFIYVHNTTNNHIIIRNKKSEEIVHESYIGVDFMVDNNGNVYFLNEGCYKLEAPHFKKNFIEPIDVSELERGSIERMYEKEIHSAMGEYESERAKELAHYELVDKMRFKHLEEHFLVDYKNILISQPYYITVIRYNNGKEYELSAISHFLHYQKDEKTDQLNIIGDNESLSTRSDFLNDNFIISEFDDSALVSYSLSGGNHIAPGFNITTLFYYEFKTGDKIIRFKSDQEIREAVNFNDDMLVVMDNKTYKITVK